MVDLIGMSPEERKAHYRNQIELLTPPISDWQKSLLQIYQSLLDGSDLKEGVSVDE